jgi:uncharacterized protein (DUF58 family)
MKLSSWLVKKLQKKNRIYIFPTKMGGYLNGLIVLMFLLSVGYSNNLLLIFTLFLFGLNLMWVIQTHFHLHSLKLQSINLQDGFAREKNFIQVFWKNSPAKSLSWDLSLYESNQHFDIHTASDSLNHSTGEVKFPKRGHYKFSFLKVKTDMPFGLYKAWVYIPVNHNIYIYPARLKEIPPSMTGFSKDEGEHSAQQSGIHDITDLRPYQGEESRRINWKHYARSGTLVVNEGEELKRNFISFKLMSFDKNKEFVLSKITSQIYQCDKTDIEYSLDMAHKKNIKGLKNCLRELAIC